MSPAVAQIQTGLEESTTDGAAKAELANEAHSEHVKMNVEEYDGLPDVQVQLAFTSM